MTHSCLTLDPGKRLCGVALHVDGVLRAAALLRPKPDTTYQVAAMVERWLAATATERLRPPGTVDLLVCEFPQVYGGPRKADPNDLLPLAECVGAVEARVKALRTARYLPREWTKGVPKEIRLRRYLTTLTPAEIEVVKAIKGPASLLHNVLDACALGAYALGEFKIDTPEYEQ